MRFRENSKRLIALFLALVTVLSIPISAGAISYDGTGTSGKGTANSTGTGAYGIYSTTLSSDLVGYRFTGIKARVRVRAGLAWLMMNRYVLQVKQVSQKRSAPSAANRWRTVFLRP